MPTTDRPIDRPLTRRRALTALGIAGAGVAGLTACTGDKPPAWNGSGSEGAGSTEPAGKAKVSVTGPAADAKDVPASAEIVFAATDAVATTVVLKDSAGADVPGAMHPDGAGWLPKNALDYGTTYTATVTATGDDGKPATATATFATMAKPGKVVGIVSFLPDDAVLGVGMPLIFRLSRAVPQARRAAAPAAGTDRAVAGRDLDLVQRHRAALAAQGVLAIRHQDLRQRARGWPAAGRRVLRQARLHPEVQHRPLADHDD